ncbi:hypothetical protein EXS91_04440 [Helicobacter pylori]|nr:hypothetical protein [Helicobacter pylori]
MGAWEKQSLFKTPKLTLTHIKTHGIYCDPCSIKRNQVLSVIVVTHAVLRACRFYENRNIFQLFLTSVKKNCIIIFL